MVRRINGTAISQIERQPRATLLLPSFIKESGHRSLVWYVLLPSEIIPRGQGVDPNTTASFCAKLQCSWFLRGLHQTKQQSLFCFVFRNSWCYSQSICRCIKDMQQLTRETVSRDNCRTEHKNSCKRQHHPEHTSQSMPSVATSSVAVGSVARTETRRFCWYV